LPIGALGWRRHSNSPSSPATFSADPAQLVLAHALAARAKEATRMTAEAAVAAGMPELAVGRFAKPIHDLHKLATRAIARFLLTGQGTTETERNFTGKVGVMAAVFGLSVDTLNQSYLLWRDSNLRVLNEEVRRLDTPPAIDDEARRLIRSSAEIGIKRMTQAYEDQLSISYLTIPRHRPQLRAKAL
jgi:hypothetical protein